MTMPGFRRISIDRWVLLMIGIGAILLLSNLGNGRLWQDEAETAVLGKNNLLCDYPRAFDGVNRLNPSVAVQTGDAWTYHTWLPMYMAAASFLAVGATTAAARFPFALMGVISVWLSYLAARKLTGDRTVARLTTVLLVTSVPFLLHMRQCRYYAPAVLFTLWSVLAYRRFCRGKRWSTGELVLSLVLLFHADHGVFAPILAAFGLHFLISQPNSGRTRKALAATGAVLLLTVPWAIYLKSGQHHHDFSWKEISHHFQFYLRQINQFIFPIWFWLIVWLASRLTGRRSPPTPGLSKEDRLLVGLLIGMGLLFLIVVPEQRHFRYLIFLVPFFLLIEAALLARTLRSRHWLGLALICLLIFTDLAAIRIPFRIRSLPMEFIGELTHPYRGPVDGIVELLQQEGRAGETLKTPYEEHPILFYTPMLIVEPLEKSEDFARETSPDWIVLRRDWLPHGFLESPYYRQIQARYREVLLDAPDIPWQNRPDPGYHRFWTDTQAPRVVIFRRK